MKGTRLKDIVIDARHPAGLARFRATVLGYQVRPSEPEDVVTDPEGNEFRAFPAP